jgi:TonB family protein
VKLIACLLACFSTVAFADATRLELRPQYFDSLELSRKHYRQIVLRHDTAPTEGRMGVKIDEQVYGLNREQVREFESSRILFAPMIPPALRHSSCTATVRFVIDKNGDPVNPRVLSAAPKEFARAALEMVMRSKFPVITIEGKPRYVRIDLPITFSPARSGPLAGIRYVYGAAEE